MSYGFTLLRRSAEPAHSTEALKGTSRQGSGPQYVCACRGRCGAGGTFAAGVYVGHERLGRSVVDFRHAGLSRVEEGLVPVTMLVSPCTMSMLRPRVHFSLIKCL